MIRTAIQILASQARVDALQKKYPELVEDIQTLADADPSGGKHKYLQWQVNQLRKKSWDPADLISVVSGYHANLKFIEEKDINQFKSLEDLEEVVLGAVERSAEEAKFPDQIYNKNGVRIYNVETQAQMCKIGEGSGWCVAHPGGSYWGLYTGDPGWAFYVVQENEGDTFLAYVRDGILDEMKDWENNDMETQTHIVEALKDAKLITFSRVVVEDADVRAERQREEAYSWAMDELVDFMREVVDTASEEVFDEFMSLANEEYGEDSYWEKTWAKYLPWAEKRLDTYVTDKLYPRSNVAVDEWGFGPWEFEWEPGDRDDSPTGEFEGQKSAETYASALVKEFLTKVMGWKEDDGNPPGWADHDYLKPWQELVDKVARVARSLGVR